MVRKRGLLFLFLGFVFVISISLADKAYANSTIGTAKEISVNKNYAGKLSDYNDEHYFKFTLTNPGNVVLSVKNMPGASWDSEILDSSGNTLIKLNTNDSGAAIGSTEKQIGLGAGTYYVSIADYYWADEYSYSFQVKYTKSDSYETEMNNTATTADAIKVNKTYKGSISDYEDLDYHTFKLTKPGNVTISMKNLSGASWEARLFNSVGKEMTNYTTDSDSYVTAGYSEKQMGLPAGKYYVVLTNYYDTVGKSYELRIKYNTNNYYEKEFNDSAKTANSISINKSYKGIINDYDDIDYYKFTLSKESIVQLLVKQKADSSWQASLLNGAGKNLKTLYTESDRGVTGNKVSETKLKKGTYYVSVENYYFTTDVPYELKVRIKTDSLKASQMKIINNKGKSDTITVSKIAKGDVIRVYNAKSGGKQLASATSKGSSVSLKVKQLGKKSGKVYVTVTKSGQVQSSRISVSYSGEVSDALKSSQVKILNKKGKSDTITVSKIYKGDVIKIYNSKSKGKVIVKGTLTTNSKTKTLSVKQLGEKAGKVYITITKPGQKESMRTTISYSKEK